MKFKQWLEGVSVSRTQEDKSLVRSNFPENCLRNLMALYYISAWV